MSTKAFNFDGARFVTNNYAAILDNTEAPNEFHLIQYFFGHSDVMYALTPPESISQAQVLTFWRTTKYNDGGDHGSPSLTCQYEGQENFVSPETVRKALHLPEHTKYNASVSTQTLRDMINFFGYFGCTDLMGDLKRPNLCKEWSFFYDCITRAFGNKCSDFDAIPILSQQIGYSLIHNLNFDIATSILRFIGDRRQENKNIIYYARFCQLIFSYCFPNVPLPETNTEPPFKITKRAFTDLIKKDSKKVPLPVFAIPVTVQDKLKLALQDKYNTLFSDDNQPQPSTSRPKSVSTSGPSQNGSIVKSDLSSPKRTLRSSKHSPHTSPSSPPRRKRKFLQPVLDSDEDAPHPPSPPPVKQTRKKIKPTSITDLIVDPPTNTEIRSLAMIPFSDPHPQFDDPVLIEPI